MKKPTMIKLTKSLIDSIIPKEIIYAEVDAEGNSGEIMLYKIKDDMLICYETNVFTDEELYIQAKNLLLKHQDHFKNNDIEIQEILFDHVYGLLGNNVFVKKNITLEIMDGYFIYKKSNVEYQIIPSGKRAFNRVVYAMKNPKSEA